MGDGFDDVRPAAQVGRVARVHGSVGDWGVGLR